MSNAEYSVCTVNPKRYYIEFEEPQCSITDVYDAIRKNFQTAKIDTVSPTSPTLWLVTLLEPLKEPE